MMQSAVQRTGTPDTAPKYNRTGQNITDFEHSRYQDSHSEADRNFESYIFSENDRAIHARHAEVALGRQFVPKNALDFATHYPAKRSRGKVKLSMPIEECLICRPRALSQTLRGVETVKVDMATRTHRSTRNSYAITKTICDSQKLFKTEQQRPWSATKDEGIDRVSHLVTIKNPGDALECTMGKLLRQTTPPTPHPPRF